MGGKEESTRKPFGQLSVELGLVDPGGLERALADQREDGERLGAVLARMGLLTDMDRARVLSTQLSLPFATSEDYPDKPVLAGRVSEAFMREFKIMPLSEAEDGVALAMVDPLDESTAREIGLTVGKPVLPFVAAESEFEVVMNRLYQNGRTALDEIVDDAGAVDDEIGLDDAERLRDMASEAPIIRLVHLIIERALKSRASDIHIEPFDNELKVRYRIDGMLREVEAPPRQLGPAVISRIKIMAKLNIAERRLPQDGRIRLHSKGRILDLRVATIPSLHGEGVVIRILDRGGIQLDFQSLGFEAVVAEELLGVLKQPNGIVIVTGPTGSGKSTTLYAALGHLNRPERKIITVEDPVEFQVPGVMQLPVKPQIGLTFASVLRSMVRQDPDVIMIGEMRDRETADIAVHAALTGHLVLSTLHTNQAAGAVTRLQDMGVESFMLTSTLRAVLAQRLVRTLCQRCRKPYDAPPHLIESLRSPGTQTPDDTVLFHPTGCDACAGTGYSGRLAILELMVVTDRIRQLILSRADSNTIHNAATDGGMRTMLDGGIEKVLSGVTTIEELRRVTEEV